MSSKRRKKILIRSNLTLYIGGGLPKKTCCDSSWLDLDVDLHHRKMKYECDLIYDSSNKTKVTLGRAEASDHIPLNAEIDI